MPQFRKRSGAGARVNRVDRTWVLVKSQPRTHDVTSPDIRILLMAEFCIRKSQDELQSVLSAMGLEVPGAPKVGGSEPVNSPEEDLPDVPEEVEDPA